MKIIASIFSIISPTDRAAGIEMLRKIESAARVSHKAEDAQTPDSWQRFIKAVVIDRGDWSVTEHASATVVFDVNRGITHELVRHRLFGFTQESTRFVNYTQEKHEARYAPSGQVLSADLDEWIDDLVTADEIYRKWLLRGYTPQIARDHLPNALAATIVVTGNLRNWRHALIARTTKETHPDFRKVMSDLLIEFQNRIPLLYNDISPDDRQSIAFSKPR